MSSHRLYKQIARQILTLIDSGEYPAGTRLPGERELAEQFGVSRVVIREAELSLETLGHVEIKIGSGVYVRTPSVGTLSRMQTITAFDLTQTRLTFEAENAAFAARVISDAQIAELERVLEQMKGETPVVADGDDSDHNFHLLIAAATGNQANVHILEELWRIRTEVETVRSVYSVVCETSTEHRFEEHQKIFEAIRDRNPERAREAMTEHFSRLFEALLDASEQQAINEARRRSLSNRERYLKSVSAV